MFSIQVCVKEQAPSTQCPHIIQLCVTDNSPYWIYNKSRDEEYHTKHNEEGVTEALVLGIVGQLGCLWEDNTTIDDELCIELFLFLFCNNH